MFTSITPSLVVLWEHIFEHFLHFLLPVPPVRHPKESQENQSNTAPGFDVYGLVRAVRAFFKIVGVTGYFPALATRTACKPVLVVVESVDRN